jgi:hypothetical protein
VIFTVNSVIQFTANFREMYFNLSTKPSLTERIGDIHCQSNYSLQQTLEKCTLTSLLNLLTEIIGDIHCQSNYSLQQTLEKCTLTSLLNLFSRENW